MSGSTARHGDLTLIDPGSQLDSKALVNLVKPVQCRNPGSRLSFFASEVSQVTGESSRCWVSERLLASFRQKKSRELLSSSRKLAVVRRKGRSLAQETRCLREKGLCLLVAVTEYLLTTLTSMQKSRQTGWHRRTRKPEYDWKLR